MPGVVNLDFAASAFPLSMNGMEIDRLDLEIGCKTVTHVPWFRIVYKLCKTSGVASDRSEWFPMELTLPVADGLLTAHYSL